MGRIAAAVSAVLLVSSLALGWEQPSEPAKELVQYVLEARKHGLKDTAIKTNATGIGWSADAVDAALAYKGDRPQPVAKDAATSKSPQVGKNEIVDTPPLASAEPVTAKAPPPSREVVERLENKGHGVPDGYQVGAGDVLQISVWKEPDASVNSVVVRPDGKISMPLLKEVEVAGLTPTELERSITEKLARFVNTADVTVMVLAINSKKVYIVGAARREGPLPYTYQMTIMQAISEAGGLTEYAKRKKIYVLRTANAKEYQMPFNYDEVIRGVKTEQNIQLLPGDTVIIPH